MAHKASISLLIILLSTISSLQSVYGSAFNEPGKHRIVHTPISTFVSELQTTPIDLVILLERTQAVGRPIFYLEARKFISYILRYYAKIGPRDVRLVVATFAADFKVHMNGMAYSLTKCDIWERHWRTVVMNDNRSVWNITNVKTAYKKALDIFKAYSTIGNKKYVWLLTSGDYRESGEEPERTRDRLIDEGVHIVATKITPREGMDVRIRLLVKNPQDYGGDISMWFDTLYRVRNIADVVNLVRTLRNHDGVICFCDLTYGFTTCERCDHCPCSHLAEKDCICVNGPNQTDICARGRAKVCAYDGGMTGRYCNVQETECIPNACSKSGKCLEHVGYYKCYCSTKRLSPVNTYCEPFEKPLPDMPSIGQNTDCRVRPEATPAAPQLADEHAYANGIHIEDEQDNISYMTLIYETEMPAMPVIPPRLPPRLNPNPNEGATAAQPEGEHVYENAACYSKTIATSWQANVPLVSASVGLKDFAIVSRDRKMYATTSRKHFLPSIHEVDEMHNVLSMFEPHDGIIKMNDLSYRVTQNDGQMLKAYAVQRHFGVLIIAQSRLYFMIGSTDAPQHSKNCYEEVKRIRDILYGQTK